MSTVIEAGVTTPVAILVVACLTTLVTAPTKVGGPETAGGVVGVAE